MHEFNWPVRVYYEDTDSGGVVYYANYLRFMERARTEWLRTLGFDQAILRDQQGVLFAVSRSLVDYKSPARFNDLLNVTATIGRCRRASLEFHQQISRDGDDRLLCSGEVRVACVDAGSFRPRPIPEEMMTVFNDGF